MTSDWDKTFALSDKVSHRKASFTNRFGIALACDVYEPKGASGKLPAIAVSGPFGAVKEQASGLYAQAMAERGFVAIAFDPSFTGESGGEPRFVASPDINTEDFSAAVDFLSLQPSVDPERIGIIGICGWGGIALNAAAVEKYGPGSYYDMAGTAPGDFLFKDLNGDGHITTADKDYLGNGFPALSYGLNLTASYRNWDLSVYMYGALGQTLLSWSKCYLTAIRNESNGYFNFLSEAVKDTWSPSNKGAAYPRATRTDVGSNSRVSDFYVEKADYMKISNLQIGYTFDKKVLRGVFRNARLSLSVQNLLTLSPYTKFGDPEVSSGVTSTGYDSGRYPFPRTFLLGVQLGL